MKVKLKNGGSYPGMATADLSIIFDAIRPPKIKPKETELADTNLDLTGEVIIKVVSSSGMNAGDSCGIKLNNDKRHWTTIDTINSLGQITIKDPIPSSAAHGNSVFTLLPIIEIKTNDLIAAGAEENKNRFHKNGVAIFWLKDLEVIQP